MAAKLKYCALLRTKTGYYRSPEGERLIHPASSTACYNCLLTQQAVGPDGMPVDARSCGESRACFREES